MTKSRNPTGKLVWSALTSGVLGVQGCQEPSGPPKLPFVGEWVDRLDDLGFVALMLSMSARST